MKQATILFIFLAALVIGHAQSTDTLSSTTANYLKTHSLGAAFIKMEQKAATGIPRPDGGHNAFPSGHTATAFAAAEFLRQEYKDVSPLYGVAGYLMAAGTGALRMYNNVHWFKDVLAGAGIGMLSTNVAYWIYPSIQKKIFPHSNAVALVMPAYEGGGWGASMMFAIGL